MKLALGGSEHVAPATRRKIDAQHEGSDLRACIAAGLNGTDTVRGNLLCRKIIVEFRDAVLVCTRPLNGCGLFFIQALFSLYKKQSVPANS